MKVKISLLALLIITSCVPQKEFEKVQQKKQKCAAEREELKEANRNLEIDNKELRSKVDILKKKNERLKEDSLQRAKRITFYQKKNQELKDKYEDLKATQEKLVKGTSKETKELLAEIQNTQEQLQKKEDRLRTMEDNLKAKKRNLNTLKTELEEKKKRLVELERILNRKDSLVKAIREKVTDALLGFKGEGLNVHKKNGKVYVSLDEKLLFPSGSTVIDQRGKQALKKLAKVLERNPDINIMVEGHTDNVPYISDKAIKDNWDLSVKRATAVVRILMNNSNIDGERIIAAGRSKYKPLEPNDSKEAKRRNRRTEIILTPKLGELLQILNKN
mgnify:CR=1 FL=1